MRRCGGPGRRVAPTSRRTCCQTLSWRSLSKTPAPANSPERTAIRFEHFDASLSRKVVVDDEMPATSREQYRRLGAAMHHIQASTGMKAVMITSALPGEGKTLTAANLALTLSESYDRRVLLDRCRFASAIVAHGVHGRGRAWADRESHRQSR